MKVFLNNKIVRATDAQISVFDHGFLYGDLIFETLKYENKQIIYLEDHLNRLKKACQQQLFNFPNLDFVQIIENLIQINKLKKARIRISFSRGNNNFIFSKGSKITCLISTENFNSNVNWMHYGSKTDLFKIDRLPPQVKKISSSTIYARQFIEKNNLDECFFVNFKNEIMEGSISNIFFIKDQTIITPPLNQCLDGVIRKKIIKILQKNNFSVLEKSILESEIKSFSEAFWTNSLHHIVPIKQIGKYDFTIPGFVTQKIISFLMKDIKKSLINS